MSSKNRIELLKATMRAACVALPHEIKFNDVQPQVCLLVAWSNTSALQQVAGGVPESWISALTAGGGTHMQQGIEAAIAADTSLSDLIVCCDGDVSPFQRGDISAFSSFYRTLNQALRIHFVAIGDEADKATMQQMAAAANGYFVHRPDDEGDD